MKIRRVPEDNFWEEYNLSFKKVEVPTESDQDALRERIYALQDAISKSLGQRWESESDFEIGEDYDYWYHVCGGVYSRRIVCADYLRLIGEALNSDPEPSIWTFHTAVEAGRLDGQFYIRAGEVFYPDDGPNFGRLLKRKFVLW